MNIRTDQDDELLKMLCQGEVHALKHFINIYFPVLTRYAKRILHTEHAAAEDVVEEVFLKLWERHASFIDMREVKGFLYTSVHNGCLNVLRSRHREQARNEAFTQLYTDDADAAENEVIHSELLALVRTAIDSLPEKMREIFLLSHYKKLTNVEIASQLNLSHQTVRNQKSKALSLLKKRLLPHTPASFVVIHYLSGL
jgi:RNA polymerase sigma-70 factor (ECF subfamily)